MTTETDILSFDRLLLSFSAVIQRPRNNSFYIFDTQSSLLKDEEIKTPMDGHERQTIKFAIGETKIIALIEADYCNLIGLNSDGLIALQIIDQTQFGFGETGFGGGGFGGDTLGKTTQGINGLFVAQGKFTDLSITNLDNKIVKIDIIAVKFEV